MAANVFEVTVTIKHNGRALPGFPLVRRLSCEAYQDSTSEHADEAAEASLADDYKAPWNTANLTYPKFVFITADQEIRIHPGAVDAASLYPIVLNANGFLLAVDMGSSDASNATLKICNNGAASVERAIVGSDTTP